jgi:hypothetical protein
MPNEREKKNELQKSSASVDSVVVRVVPPITIARQVGEPAVKS